MPRVRNGKSTGARREDDAAEVIGHGRRTPMTDQPGDDADRPSGDSGADAEEVIGHGIRGPFTEQPVDDADGVSEDADLTAETERRA